MSDVWIMAAANLCNNIPSHRLLTKHEWCARASTNEGSTGGPGLTRIIIIIIKIIIRQKCDFYRQDTVCMTSWGPLASAFSRFDRFTAAAAAAPTGRRWHYKRICPLCAWSNHHWYQSRFAGRKFFRYCTKRCLYIEMCLLISWPQALV